MAERLILGIDVGTTSVKAGLINTRGEMISSFAESYPTTRSANKIVEQNPDHWVELINKAIEQFVAEGYRHSIKAVGLCSQVNTHVFIDKYHKPLMPAVLWQDGRASVESTDLDSVVSDEQKCAWWGAPMPIDASNVLSRMLWVSRHEPALWEKTRWILLPKDYCLLKLTGEVTTDPLSNIGLVDRELHYIDAVFDLVKGSADKIAPLKAVTETIGTIHQDSALAGIPVVSGTMDAWAGLVGAGGAKNESSVYLSGTSEILGISSTTVVPTPGAIVFAPNDGIVIHAAPTQSGGDAKQWFGSINSLGPEQMSDLVGQTPRTDATPLFLPQLEGERAPLWDVDLRAVFLGMSRRTSLGDLARSVYEGVAFSARHAFETVQASSATKSLFVNCGGGGFRSPVWNQIRADVFGVELRTLATNEPGVLGAVIIAGIAVGDYGNFEQAHDAVSNHDRIYQPSASANAIYNDLFEIYKDSITQNAQLTRRLALAGTQESDDNAVDR